MGGPIDRRSLLAAAAGGSLAAAAARGAVHATAALAETCARLAGLDLTPHEREQMLPLIDDELDRLRALRGVSLENDLAPAELFDPRLPGWAPRTPLHAPARLPVAPALPGSAAEIAFAPAWMQAAWIRARRISALALTDLYLDRITRLGGKLQAFALVPAEQARAQAAACDRELAAGKSRGPLHGLPYALKDLFDTAGLETAWGAEPYRGRVPERDAVVVERLREAGAVLLAKTSCGALAYGDIWYGGQTRNPWNLDEGSSGSSAGSAAAVAAGLCSFAIGTETMGSIVSPATRCGTVGLRPTFGRIARTGAMALCWSLDKVGVLARDPRDSFAVLGAIQGSHAGDAASLDMPLGPLPKIELRNVRLGIRPDWFAKGNPLDRDTLARARDAGFQLVEIDMPATDPHLLGAIVPVESAAAFEPLTLDGRDDALKWQAAEAWPNTWRAARYEPAIGYVQAQRLRRRLMGEFARTMAGVDAILHPNGAGSLTSIGNHCGYPAMILPAGLLDQPTRVGFETYRAPGAGDPGPLHRVPFPIVLTGHLFDEARLTAIGIALAEVLPTPGRPPLFT